MSAAPTIRVIRVKGDSALIETDLPVCGTACSVLCGRRPGLIQLADGSTGDLKAGDALEVRLGGLDLFSLSARLYGAPLAGLLAGALIGASIGGDPATAAGACAGLAMGLGLAAVHARRCRMMLKRREAGAVELEVARAPDSAG